MIAHCVLWEGGGGNIDRVATAPSLLQWLYSAILAFVLCLSGQGNGGKI